MRVKSRPQVVKLTAEQKALVVRRLATYHTPTAIARDLKELFGVEMTVQGVQHYDAEKAASDDLSPCWKQLFWATRKAFIAACAETGTMEQMVRVRLREDMVLMARDAGHYRIANELLDSIAKEAGQIFINRHMLARNGMAAPGGLSARVEYENEDGTREVSNLGDPGEPLMVIRVKRKKGEVG